MERPQNHNQQVRQGGDNNRPRENTITRKDDVVTVRVIEVSKNIKDSIRKSLNTGKASAYG